MYQISSVKAGPYIFGDLTSNIPVTIIDSLSFIIPADQERPLQILEISLVTVGSDSGGREKIELELQLRNHGFSILNGIKNAVDRVDLTFSTEQDCDAFRHAMASSLQNVPTGASAHAMGGSDIYKDNLTPRPKKQSRAVMIDLPQDVVISGNTQLPLEPLQIPHKVSRSDRIDVSASRESSVVATSPPRAISEIKGTNEQSEADEERQPQDTCGTIYTSDLLGGGEVAKKSDRGQEPRHFLTLQKSSGGEMLQKESVASSMTGLVNVHSEGAAQSTKERLPQQANKLDSAQRRTASPATTSSRLQQAALKREIVNSHNEEE